MRFEPSPPPNPLRRPPPAEAPPFIDAANEAGGPPIINADETWPYPENPAGLYPLTKGQAERLVLDANRPDFQTVAIRPPFIWGRDDSSVLPQMIAAVKRGQWVWFNGGHYRHTTTHIANVIEGLLLAAEKGRGGEVYFITDGDPPEFREFVTAMLATRCIELPNRSMPYGLANALAAVSEGIWKALNLRSMPPLPRSALYLMGQEVTVNDKKARTELGYEGKMTIEEGLREMKDGIGGAASPSDAATPG